MRFGSTLRLLRRFSRQPWRRRLLLIEAALWLTAARLAILLLPFPRIARYLGRLHRPGGDPAVRESERLKAEPVAREIAWAIARVAPCLPFPLVCLPRGLAAWQMLHRRGVRGQLHFGASRQAPQSPLETHAWVDAYGIEVSGYPEALECLEIGFFSR